MRHDEISTDLLSKALDFFYWISRFEFALKENRFLRNDVSGSRAELGWDAFVERLQKDYSLTVAGDAIIAENPKRQMAGDHGLEFQGVRFHDGLSDLGKVILCTVAIG